MPRLLSTLLLALLLAPATASAQWASLGDVSKPTRSGNTLTFKNAQGVVAVTAVAPDIIRVRFAPVALGRDHSYAVVGESLGDPGMSVETTGDRTFLRTFRLVVTIAHKPFRISIADASGAVIDADDPARGIAFSGTTTRVWKTLPDDEQIYGLGEKNGHLNKRGRQLGGYNVTMWNSDTYAYEADTDPIYADVPFYLALRQGHAHGVFFDNTFRSNFDIGHTSQGLLAFGADGGELNYYVIDGPALKDVVRRYTDLTGQAAAAAALVARLQPVPLQLLPRVEGPVHRRQLPPAADSRRRHLARHPLPGRLRALHVGQDALPGSGAA